MSEELRKYELYRGTHYVTREGKGKRKDRYRLRAADGDQPGDAIMMTEEKFETSNLSDRFRPVDEASRSFVAVSSKGGESEESGRDESDNDEISMEAKIPKPKRRRASARKP